MQARRERKNASLFFDWTSSYIYAFAAANDQVCKYKTDSDFVLSFHEPQV